MPTPTRLEPPGLLMTQTQLTVGGTGPKRECQQMDFLCGDSVHDSHDLAIRYKPAAEHARSGNTDSNRSNYYRCTIRLGSAYQVKQGFGNRYSRRWSPNKIHLLATVYALM